MSVHIYHPEFINYCFCYVYDDIKSFIYHNPEYHSMEKIPVFISMKKPDLVYFMFDHRKKIWNLYHALQDSLFVSILITEFNKIESMLNKENKYVGVLIHSDLKILARISQDGQFHINEHCFLSLDTKTGFVSYIIYNDIKQKYELKNDPVFIFSDILLPSISKKSLIYLNSSSIIDFIFFSLTYPMHVNMLSAPYIKFVEFFKNRLSFIKDLKPKDNYNKIFSMFKEHDREYYDLKMNHFQSATHHLINTFENYKELNEKVDFINSFIEKLRNDLCIEISLIYNRLLNFPHEKHYLNMNYDSHPLMRFINMLDNTYNTNPTKLTYMSILSIECFISKNKDSGMNVLMQDIVRVRSSLFIPMYKEFLNTQQMNIKPLGHKTYEYFSFRIFSPSIFIMEHLLLS